MNIRCSHLLFSFFSLATLIPGPRCCAQTEATAVRISRVSFNTSGDREHRVYYKSEEDLLAQRPMLKEQERHKVWLMDAFQFEKVDDAVLKAGLDSALRAGGIQVIGDSLRSARYKSITLSTTVEDWTYELVDGGPHRFILKLRFKFLDPASRTTLMDTVVDSRSSIEREKRYAFDQTMASALRGSLEELVAGTRIRELLVNTGVGASGTYAAWEELSLPAGTARARKNQVEAAVTMKQGDRFWSGFIVSPDGHILTSSWEIEEEDSAKMLKAMLHDGAELPCTLLRLNDIDGVALLRVERSGLISFGMDPAAALELGDPLTAVATSLSTELAPGLAQGILSGERQRKGLNYYQTDVGFNQGNAGGALIAENDRVVGMLIGKLGANTDGIGFAVPMKRCLSALKLTVQE